MTDPDCPRCRALQEPIILLIAGLLAQPEQARNPRVRLAITVYLEGLERQLAEWVLADLEARPDDDAFARYQRVKGERPRLGALASRAFVPPIGWLEVVTIDETLDALAGRQPFGWGAKPERPARVRKGKPRAWERTLRVDRPQDPAA